MYRFRCGELLAMLELHSLVYVCVCVCACAVLGSEVFVLVTCGPSVFQGIQ